MKSDTFSSPITDLDTYSVLDYERTVQRLFNYAETLFRGIEGATLGQ